MALVRTPVGMALEADVLFARWNGSSYEAWAKLPNSISLALTQNTDQQTLVGRDRSNFNNTVASLTTKEDTEITITCNMYDGISLGYAFLGTESDQAASSVSVSTNTVLAVSGSEAYIPHHNVSSVVVSGGTITTDYTLDTAGGVITVVSGGALDGDTTITVSSYDYAELVGSRIQMGTQTEIEGKIQILSINRAGSSKKMRVELDSVKLSPDGDFTLFNEDEFGEISFSGVAQIPSGQGYFGQTVMEA